ncbi:hypothetical protein E4U40_003883 [Claviceps sp. LM458 group G5]|nr:hypothetical protein E4U40_003883 [Claviceps sp. LM458 group G5]KAG6047186.1 hypothetical protein E4U39_000681 [Claviceps sp. Clav50 group G5]
MACDLRGVRARVCKKQLILRQPREEGSEQSERNGKQALETKTNAGFRAAATATAHRLWSGPSIPVHPGRMEGRGNGNGNEADAWRQLESEDQGKFDEAIHRATAGPQDHSRTGRGGQGASGPGGGGDGVWHVL